MIDKTYTAMAAVVFVVAGLGVALIPDAGEQQAALMRDGLFAEALTSSPRLTKLATRRDVLHRVELLQLAGSHMEAFALLDAEASTAPDDPVLQMSLLQALEVHGSQTRRVQTAHDIIKRWRSPHAVAILLDHHRRMANTDGEHQVLRLAAFTGQIAMHDLERLGMIEAARGSVARAIEHLVDVDASRIGLGRGGQITLFQLLIDAGDTPGALRRAARWLSAAKDETGASDLCLILAVAGQTQAAWAILERVGHNWDRHARECIDRLVDYQEFESASELLIQAARHRKVLCKIDLPFQAAARRTGDATAIALWSATDRECE